MAGLRSASFSNVRSISPPAREARMSTARPSGQPPKLRKSCDVCAATKVGCSKEKPTCSRCAKRGLKCSYSTARRAGRTARTLVQNAAMSTDTPTSPLSETIDYPVPGLDYDLPQSPQYFDIRHSNNLFNSLSPDDSNMLHALTDDFDFDGYFASIMSNPLDDGCGVDPALFDLDLDTMEGHNITTSSSGSSSGSISSTNLTTPSSRSSSLFLSSKVDGSPLVMSRASSCSAVPTVASSCNDSIPTSGAPLQASCHSRTDSALCQCHSQAARLSSRLSARIPSSGSQPSDDLDEFQAIVAQNEETVDQIRNILQCPCSSDSDLLVTLSLLLFKLIARYTSATHTMSRQLGSSTEPPFSPDSRGQSPLFSEYYDQKDLEGEDQQRLAVQLILSKLTGVQVLVERLSQRLQGLSTPDHRDDTLSFSEAFGHSPGGMMPATQLISTELAFTLQADLRKRLHNLSQAIIDRLRRT